MTTPRSLVQSFESDSYLCLWFLGVGWGWVHLVRRPLTGLLYQTRMIVKYREFGGMRITRRSTRRKPAPVPPSTTNPTWLELGRNPGETGDWPPELGHGLDSYSWSVPSSLDPVDGYLSFIWFSLVPSGKFWQYMNYNYWCRNSLLLQSVKVHRSVQKRSPLKPNLTQLNPFRYTYVSSSSR
jgi:hypothetical protein